MASLLLRSAQAKDSNEIGPCSLVCRSSPPFPLLRLEVRPRDGPATTLLDPSTLVFGVRVEASRLPALDCGQAEGKQTGNREQRRCAGEPHQRIVARPLEVGDA